MQKMNDYSSFGSVLIVCIAFIHGVHLKFAGLGQRRGSGARACGLSRVGAGPHNANNDMLIA